MYFKMLIMLHTYQTIMKVVQMALLTAVNHCNLRGRADCVTLYIHFPSCYSTYFTINQMQRASQCKIHCADVPSCLRVGSPVLLYRGYS